MGNPIQSTRLTFGKPFPNYYCPKNGLLVLYLLMKKPLFGDIVYAGEGVIMGTSGRVSVQSIP